MNTISLLQKTLTKSQCLDRGSITLSHENKTVTENIFNRMNNQTQFQSCDRNLYLAPNIKKSLSYVPLIRSLRCLVCLKKTTKHSGLTQLIQMTRINTHRVPIQPFHLQEEIVRLSLS